MRAQPMNARERVQTNPKRFLPWIRWVALFIFAVGLGFIYAAANYPRINGLIATVQLSFELSKKSATGNWFPARFERSGVLRYDAARTQPGYTLYGVTPDLSAHLIDMNGRELHRWSLTREEVMPEAASQARTFFGILKPQIEESHLFSNGDLLLVYEQQAMGEWGGPLVKLDKNSRILWKADVKAHHAVEVVGEKIYVLTQTFRPPLPTPIVPSFAGMPYIDDNVTILDSNGKVLSSHSVLQALVNTKNMRLADEVPFNDRAEPLHTNSLDVLDEQTAPLIPGAKPGNVLVSLRHLNMLAVMDLESDTFVWALRGSWRAQHDAKVLPNGHILLFDDEGGLLKHGKSRVLEISPDTGGIVWSFDGADDDPLYSTIRGSAQRMTGGDTLISESTSGRILEVTPDGSVVWEYVHPLQELENGRKIVAALSLGVTRYEPSYVSFLDGK
jgi:Arylsulfotransferase (ASST)